MTARLVGLGLIALTLTACPRFQEGPVAYPAAPGRFLEANGRRVHVVESGDPKGPPVVFIHGFASSWVVWGPLMKDLGTRHRVIALDLPGFGFSDKGRGDYSPAGLADLVAEVMRQKGVEKAHVVAHSWGSAITLALAARHPQRVGRIALLGAFVYDEQIVPFMRWAKVRGIGELLYAAFYKERVGDRFAMAFFDPERNVLHPVVKLVEAALRRPGAVRAALEATRQMDLRSLEPGYLRIAHPALLLWGREDDVALLRFGERLARELPRAHLRVFPRCGHFPMIEAYGATLDALRRHLEPAP